MYSCVANDHYRHASHEHSPAAAPRHPTVSLSSGHAYRAKLRKPPGGRCVHSVEVATALHLRATLYNSTGSGNGAECITLYAVCWFVEVGGGAARRARLDAENRMDEVGN